jgi:hypothetical protein
MQNALKVEAESHEFCMSQGATGYLKAQRIDVLKFEFRKALWSPGHPGSMGYTTKL